MKTRRFLPLVLAALCLISAGQLLLESASSENTANTPDDLVTAWDEHMRLVRAGRTSVPWCRIPRQST
jgi:hypothetical protein